MDIELAVRGCFWINSHGCIAEVPSLKMTTIGQSIDESLYALQSMLEETSQGRDVEYFIELIGGNCFHIKSSNPEVFKELISYKISNKLTPSPYFSSPST